MDLSKLSNEEKANLLAELEAFQRAEKEKKEQDRELYKLLKDEAIRELFGMLQEMSQKMISLKGIVFNRFDTIIDLKNELYNSKMDRQSNTFTTEDATISIKIGNRMNEGWDDTVDVGVEKVRNFLKSLAKDADSGDLVDTVMRLLSKDRKGNLKASKVLELEQLAARRNDKELTEGVQIIKAAYRPEPSCQFIEVRYKDELGKETSLPLSMSAI